eukprot:scaffold668252_cov57-Prasinocladus_malaysianus.AAC.1
MDHTIGDGHTYYTILGMLDKSSDILALDPKRNQDSIEASTVSIGPNKHSPLAAAQVVHAELWTVYWCCVRKHFPTDNPTSLSICG